MSYAASVPTPEALEAAMHRALHGYYMPVDRATEFAAQDNMILHGAVTELRRRNQKLLDLLSEWKSIYGEDLELRGVAPSVIDLVNRTNDESSG